MKTGIFRDELPGERKSIINTLMWGWILVISILGYFAFYLTIQLEQVNLLLEKMPPGLTGDEFTFIQSRLIKTINRLETEILWLAVLGSIFAVVGGLYTFNLVVRPLRKLVQLAEGEPVEPPEIKSNNEIKQLLTAIHPPNMEEAKSIHLKN
ncbi:MAG: hypothetical protein G3M70_07970 [Candidatus Nitronauta litoralis]|uniref:HAMP domain-containing protein n=1 Tax=Candidatus Nitronauta litoralis TaxID=2705533 RepID=A0A7T0G0D6_9BACT|nr:MAG: hypothetical protein G3M70_07970 [Candidatus Nitronauta litoralis]